MDTIVLPPIEHIENPVTRYELPPEGITSLGYFVRRMHKTEMLHTVYDHVASENAGEALASIALYTAAAAVSFGSLYYEPSQDLVGSTVTEHDPITGAIVTATLVNQSPNDHYTFAVQMPEGDRFHGFEHTSDSRIGFRGWILPAQSNFLYISRDESYKAECTGTLTREVVPRIAGPWHSRAHGSLSLSDSWGNVGTLTLHRNAQAVITVNCCGGKTVLHREHKLS